MARLLVHVEGQTEEAFVNEVLREHLVTQGYHSVDARIVGNSRVRRRRGGIRPWPAVRQDITTHLKEDRGSIATSMVDYYALPKEWPGRTAAPRSQSVSEKARSVEGALLDDLATKMGAGFRRERFVPFVVMHEFEGLLFSDCVAFSRGIGRQDLEGSLAAIRDTFDTPEDIDDSPATAPSKRIEGLLPGYEKPLYGLLAILEIGLTAIRTECRHFDDWLKRLESLVR